MPKRRQYMRQPARTVLEQMIRERRETFEEFVESAESFARDHQEPGTLSVRHLQRLVAGRYSDGTPLGPLRPATARLLERIFGLSIAELLVPPGGAVSLVASRNVAHVFRVAVAVVINCSEVLIVCRRGEVDDGILWQFPAGIIKPGSSPGKVAVRETFDETGVHCTVRSGLGSRLHPMTSVICDYVLCDYLSGSAENMDRLENVDVSWVDKAKLTSYIPEGQIFLPVLQALEGR